MVRLPPVCSERLRNLLRDTQPHSSRRQGLIHACLPALCAAQPCPRPPHTPPSPPALTQPHGSRSLHLLNEPRSRPHGQRRVLCPQNRQIKRQTGVGPSAPDKNRRQGRRERWWREPEKAWQRWGWAPRMQPLREERPQGKKNEGNCQGKSFC